MRLLEGRRPNIAKLARRRDVHRLLRALTYEDPVIDRAGQFVDLGTDVRVAAVAALAGLDDTDALAGVVRALGDPEPAVRRIAARTLGERADALAVAPLVAAVRDWDDPELAQARQEAITALQAAAGPDAARQLALALLTGEREIVRGDADFLRRLADEHRPGGLDDAISTLLDNLSGPGDRAARLLALLAPDSVPGLIECLEMPGRQVAAAQALAATHDSRAVPALSELLRSSDESAARAAAARALGEIRDPAAVESLLVASGDRDYDVRVAAGESFDRFGNVAIAIAVSAVALRGSPSLPPAVTTAAAEQLSRRKVLPTLTFRAPSTRETPLWRRLSRRTGTS